MCKTQHMHAKKYTGFLGTPAREHMQTMTLWPWTNKVKVMQ